MAEDKNTTPRRIIGKASATERDPNSSERFSVWLASEEILNPFDIVEANHMEGTRTFGLVTNIKQITDAPSHLSNYISSDFGSTESEPQTPRQGVNVAEVSVLANHDPSEPKKYPMGIYMPVQNESPIKFANEVFCRSNVLICPPSSYCILEIMGRSRCNFNRGRASNITPIYKYVYAVEDTIVVIVSRVY